MKKKKNIFKSFIPQKIPNQMTLKFFEFLQEINKKKKNKYPLNYEKNIKNYENHKKTIEKNLGYIEDQNNYTDMYYGKKQFNECGCEIIATFNALKDLNYNNDFSLPLLIDYFEKDGIVLNGNFGTSPKAIENFFKNLNFETFSSFNEKDCDFIGNNYHTFVFTFFNDKFNVFNQVHSICITKKNGKFFTHNNGDDLIFYNSMKELVFNINNGNAKLILLIGIKK